MCECVCYYAYFINVNKLCVHACVLERAKHSFFALPNPLWCSVVNKICLNQNHFIIVTCQHICMTGTKYNMAQPIGLTSHLNTYIIIYVLEEHKICFTDYTQNNCARNDTLSTLSASHTVRPGLKGPLSSRLFRVIIIGLRKNVEKIYKLSTFWVRNNFSKPYCVFSRFFKQTVGSYVCNIVLHPLLMAYVVEICDNYADLSRKVLLPMYNAHHEFGPIPSKK